MDCLENDIKNTLSEMDINYDILDDKDINYLISIESRFKKIFKRQDKLLGLLKINRPNIANMASKCSISRQTIYNNVLLKSYINFKIKKYNENDLLLKNEELHKEIISLKDTINMMTLRDIKNELQKRTIEELKNELLNTNKQIEELHHKLMNKSNNNSENNSNEYSNIVYFENK